MKVSSSTKVLAYYSVSWEQNDTESRFEINSCLYFQNDDDDSEEIRQDGCGYVIVYPAYIHAQENLQIYNFDRRKEFLLQSNDIYLNSKKKMKTKKETFLLLIINKIESLENDEEFAIEMKRRKKRKNYDLLIE